MDYTKILKQAWGIVRNYRAVWIFGVILALTTTSWPTATLYSRDDDRSGSSLIYVLPNSSSVEIPGRDDDRSDDGGDIILNYKHQADGRPYHKGDVIINYNPPDDFSVGVVSRDKAGRLDLKTLEIRPGVVRTAIAIGIGLACAIVILFIASRIARYVAETALIRMVDDYEETGKRRSVRQGFRMGWSRTAWRLFLINLVINVPAALAFTLLFALVLAPLLLGIRGSTVAGVIGTLSTISFFLLALFLTIIVGALLSLLKRFFWRACTLDELRVTESIRQGYAVVRQNLKDVSLMWLITVGLRIGWAIVMIPIVLLLLVVSGALGGLLALLAGGLTGLAFEGATPWIVAGVVGIPVFILVLAAPLAFLGGLREVFLSSTWTLTYRELRAEAAPIA